MPTISTPPETGDTGATTPTADTGVEERVIDCDRIPVQIVSQQEIVGPKGYHDLAFTDDGYVIGQGAFGDLMRADAYGGIGPFVPNVGETQQMTWLPNGDLAVASLQGILRVTPAGAKTVINPDVRPYGLITGPDGKLYAADQDKVLRVDPATGGQEVLLRSGALPFGAPRVLQFDLTYTHMYIGTISGRQGRIYVVEVGPDLTPIGQPTVFATGVGSGGYHDAIGIDICGYLYIPEYDTAALYRVSPSGQVQNLLQSGLLHRDYAHGLEWGLGVGGFRQDAIYVTQPYDGYRVLELVIGVPSRDWGGTAINVPPGL